MNKLHIVFVFIASIAAAQGTDTPSTPPNDVPLRPVVNPEPVEPAPLRFTLNLGWDEKSKAELAVPLSNPEDTPMQVLGVQSTASIFIVDFPDKVKARSEEPIDFIYDTPYGYEGEVEVIRVKTDQGIKTLHVSVQRAKGLELDKKQLAWSLNEKAEPKYVTLDVGSTGLIPQGVHISGKGHSATLEKINATTFRISVTPGSTAKAAKFAVGIDFDRNNLVGKSPRIYGTVGE